MLSCSVPLMLNYILAKTFKLISLAPAKLAITSCLISSSNIAESANVLNLVGQLHALAQFQLPGQIKSVMFSMSNCSFTAVQDNKSREAECADTDRKGNRDGVVRTPVRDLPISLLNGLFSFVVREPWWLSPQTPHLHPCIKPPKRPPAFKMCAGAWEAT